MAYRTPTHNVHPQWLPKVLHDLVWTDFTDATLVHVGTVLFDHQSYAMYHGEVVSVNTSTGRVTVRWHKSVSNVFDESYTLERLEAARLWWIDPVMQDQYYTEPIL